MSDSPSLTELKEKVRRFVEERDWTQFHNSKDLALSLSLEAAEVLELTQWKQGPELEEFLKSNKDRLSEELADVLYWVLLLASRHEVDLAAAFQAKMAVNEKKYPIDLAKGSSKKYTELR